MSNIILKLGSDGVEVANFQRFLISQGYKIEADGDYGAKTEHAVKQWQLAVGLIADGEVGENSFAMAEKVKGNVNLGSQKPTQEPMTPPSLINNPRLKKVHPHLADKVQRIIDLAKADGIELLITQGLRTFAEQDALFKKRPKVTNARGGQSMHNYGLAVDFAVMVSGKISWDEKLYRPIGKYADIVGLEWGGNFHTFKDMPHVQLPNLPSYKTLLPIYQQGGLAEVWKRFG